MLEIILTLVGDILEIAIWLFMVSIFLDFKYTYRKILIFFLLGYILLFVLITFYVEDLSIIQFPYVYIVSFVMFKGNLSQKMLNFCMLFCLNYVTELFMISFVDLGLNGNLFSATIQNASSTIWISIFKLFIIILINYILNSFNISRKFKVYILTKIQALIISILPLFSLVTMVILDYGIRRFVNVHIKVSLFLLITSVCAIFYNIVVIILIDKLILNREYIKINEMSQAQLLTQFNHYKTIVEKTEQTRKLKHDMKNHIMCIRTLIQNNEMEKAKGLLNDIENNLHCLSLEINSGNSIVDAIINEKIKESRRLEIKFDFLGVLPKEDFINPFDISTIFSNALDNAIEAAKECKEEDRFIKTSISLQGNCLLISFINSVQHNIKISGQEISSTKDDKDRHGFGLQNIYDSVKKYDGEISINCENNIFTMEILIQSNYKDASCNTKPAS